MISPGSSPSSIQSERTPSVAALIALLARDGSHVSQAIDPDRLIAEAERHGLLPLVAHRLSQERSVASNAVLLERLEARMREHARSALALTRELIRVVQHLSGVGIEPIALKGPALSWQLYGDPAMRVSRDLDLLIRPDEVRAAVDALVRHGYACERDLNGPLGRMYLAHQHDLALTSPEGCLIELHWRLLQRRFAVDWQPGTLSARSGLVHLPYPVRVLAPDDTLLFLAVHGMKHRWSQLDLIFDIGALLARFPIDVATVRARAARLGLRRTLDVSLALSAAVSGVRAGWPPVGENVDSFVTAIGEQWLRPETPGGGLTMLDLRLRERWRDRIRLLVRSVFLPAPEDWEFLPLPDRWSALYYLIRPWRLLTARR